MEFEIKPKSAFGFGFKELWNYRELFFFFTWRDIKVKYKQTILGFLWAILQPLVMAALFTFCLGNLISSNTQLNMPYGLFAFSGLVIWNIFSSGLANAGNSMVANANIIKKIYFPRLIIPFSSMLVALFDFLMSFIILIPLVYYFGGQIYLKAILYIPASVIMATIATLGLGTLLAALNVKYRDFRYVIPFFIQALMFATPVIYPIRIASNQVLQSILKLNPMSAPLELFRASFSTQPIDPSNIIYSVIVSVLFLGLGLIYFRKTEMFFADLA